MRRRWGTVDELKLSVTGRRASWLLLMRPTKEVPPVTGGRGCGEENRRRMKCQRFVEGGDDGVDA